MSLTLELDIPRDVFEAVQETRKSSALMRRVFEQYTRAQAQRLLKQAQRYPGKVKYPIQWQSQKQRRAFFATNGFGRGIGKRRTGRLRAGWQVKLRYGSNEGFLTLKNDVQYAWYVSGSAQQNFHRNTGWARVDKLVDAAQKEFADQVIEAWVQVVDSVSQA